MRNGCSTVVQETPLPDVAPSDGTRVVRVAWQGCNVALEHLRVEGSGDTWPNGNDYFEEERIGRVTRDIGSDILVDFLLAHPRP